MEDQSKIMRYLEDRQRPSTMHMAGRKPKRPTNHLVTRDQGNQEPSLLRAEALILPKSMSSQSDALKSWHLHSLSVSPSARHLPPLSRTFVISNGLDDNSHVT